MRMFEATNDYRLMRKHNLFDIFSTTVWRTREERQQIYSVYLEDGVKIEDIVDRFPTESSNLTSSSMLEIDEKGGPNLNPLQSSLFKNK